MPSVNLPISLRHQKEHNPHRKTKVMITEESKAPQQVQHSNNSVVVIITTVIST